MKYLIPKMVDTLRVACIISLFFTVGFALQTASVSADPVSQAKYNNNPVVAVVDGKPINLDDLKSAQMHDSMIQLYKIQKYNLKRKAVTLLQEEHPELKNKVTSKVSMADISRFYENTPGISGMGSFKKMKNEIHDYLVNIREATYIEKIYKKALKNGWVKDYMAAPNDFIVVVDLSSAMLWFDEDTPSTRKVLVLEYSDFQCPFCKQVQGTLSKLRTRFGDEVQFGYRHYPLPIHRRAGKLAEAVECAREQGHFWELQAIIYKNAPRNLDKAHILKLAQEVGIKNISDFESCWDAGKYKDRVFADLQEANQIGVQATPTFIVGIRNFDSATVSGEMFSGAVSEDKFVQTIEKYISLSKAPPKG